MGAGDMIRVAIVDDHALVRSGLRAFLSDQADLVVTAEGANGTEAVAIACSGVADLMLLDIAMPGANGIDALKRIRQRTPTLPVVVLSGFPETHYATAVMRSGAMGYLNKDCEPQEIIGAIRSVARGRRYVSPVLAELLAEAVFCDEPDSRPPHESFTERQLTIFLKLAQGCTVRQVSSDMNVSIKTVSTHRARVLEKLQLKTNSQLTYYAIKNGLIR